MKRLLSWLVIPMCLLGLGEVIFRQVEAAAREQQIITLAEEHAGFVLKELLSDASISNVQIRFVPTPTP